MSDTRLEVTPADAFVTLHALAIKYALTEDEVAQDPERLAARREEEQTSFDIVEEFLQTHLYGDCKPCE